ncbi:hypothetical protein [Zhihengliuella flava]|uniref:Uncharacterized protein n=1 Tax=Zhihengliuella flava TaxID=1285193 RepID=A0A931GFW5_9MICC|nr:hypothetical protein [Zhihengliuella flava]MBG6085685.1 hypothetical protein [Zhihengliuella flava]
MADLRNIADVSTGAGQPLAGVEQCTSIADIPERGRVVTGGFVEYVRYAAATDAPEFVASIIDAPAGPGGRRAPAPRMLVVWHGQRRVPGVEQGVWIRVIGALSRQKRVPVMYDPNYEILASRRELTDRLTTKRQVDAHVKGKSPS